MASVLNVLLWLSILLKKGFKGADEKRWQETDPMSKQCLMRMYTQHESYALCILNLNPCRKYPHYPMGRKEPKLLSISRRKKFPIVTYP
jgi:hypothetical protein